MSLNKRVVWRSAPLTFSVEIHPCHSFISFLMYLFVCLLACYCRVLFIQSNMSVCCSLPESLTIISQTMRGILKRKFSEVDKYPRSSSSSSSPSSLSSSNWESDGEGSSSENQDFPPHSPASLSALPSKSSNLHPTFIFFQIMPLRQECLLSACSRS